MFLYRIVLAPVFFVQNGSCTHIFHEKHGQAGQSLEQWVRELPFIFVSDSRVTQDVSIAQRKGLVHKIGGRMYTTKLDRPVEELIRSNALAIAALSRVRAQSSQRARDEPLRGLSVPPRDPCAPYRERRESKTKQCGPVPKISTVVGRFWRRETVDMEKIIREHHYMFRKYVLAFVSAATLSFIFSGCGDRGAECAVCNGGGAVNCRTGFTWTVMCAPDQNLAAIQCTEGGGSTWVAMEVCNEAGGGETGGGDPWNKPWSPGQKVSFDARTHAYVIDQIAFEELKLDSSPLFSDSSVVHELDSGFFTVEVAGPLAQALGWRVGDILLEVDGYGLDSLEGFAEAYAELAENSTFQLTIQRGADEVVLNYRIE